MKAMKAIVLGFGILFTCGCGRKVSAAFETTEGTYLGTPKGYMADKGPVALRNRNSVGQAMERPGRGYYTTEAEDYLAR